MTMASRLLTAAGGGVDKLFSDDVFSSFVYTGNSSTQTINNGIDLAGKGGMVWVKNRSSVSEHRLFDTARGIAAGSTNALTTNNTNAQTNYTNGFGVTQVFSDGFGIGNSGFDTNNSGQSYVSWTFRKAPKFFDVVTYTGDGTTQNIAHSLGITPGMVIVKCTSTAKWWAVQHRSLLATQVLQLDSSSAAGVDNAFNSTYPTATTFSVAGADQNINGATYVAYLFAHDSSADGIVQCGSYVGAAGLVTLGWEPQFVLIKNTNTTSGWVLLDTARGAPTRDFFAGLNANSSAAEAGRNFGAFTATGFIVDSTGSDTSGTGNTHIYLAIRRPNKPPTLGTQVYNAIARTGTGAAATVTGVGFAPDLVHIFNRNGFANHPLYDRLRGALLELPTNGVSETSVADSVTSFNMGGISIGLIDGNINASTAPHINHFFKRAVGVFDQVCDTGTGVAHTIAHQLVATPEFVLRATRTGGGWAWTVWHTALASTEKLVLNTTAAKATDTAAWNSTTPTSTAFSVGTGANVNTNAATYVSYLFASKTGISKCGNYTGNGTSQTIDCGFTTGARFVLIKATSTTGDWLVGDSTRGLVAGNDPRLSLNTTAAEVTSEDWLDPHSSGFIVNQVAGSNANVNGVSYLVLAFA